MPPVKAATSPPSIKIATEHVIETLYRLGPVHLLRCSGLSVHGHLERREDQNWVASHKTSGPAAHSPLVWLEVPSTGLRFIQNVAVADGNLKALEPPFRSRNHVHTGVSIARRCKRCQRQQKNLPKSHYSLQTL